MNDLINAHFLINSPSTLLDRVRLLERSVYNDYRRSFLINAPCVIDTRYENYSKLPEISQTEQNHPIHSVSCLFNKALRILSNVVKFKIMID